MPIGSGNFIEVEDNAGESVAYTGTATTTLSNLPAVADKIISQAFIVADDKNLEVSFDGGNTYLPLNKRDSLTWDVKGQIQQIKVRTSSGTADFRALINFEDV